MEMLKSFLALFERLVKAHEISAQCQQIMVASKLPPAAIEPLVEDGRPGLGPEQPEPTEPIEPVATETIGIAELDKDGVPWDARIHSSSQKKTTKGVWAKRKNLGEGVHEAVTAELKAALPEQPAAKPIPNGTVVSTPKGTGTVAFCNTESCDVTLDEGTETFRLDEVTIVEREDPGPGTEKADPFGEETGAVKTPTGPTQEEVRAELVNLVNAKGQDAARTELSRFGVEKLSDLKTEQYADAKAAFEKATTAEAGVLD